MGCVKIWFPLVEKCQGTAQGIRGLRGTVVLGGPLCCSGSSNAAIHHGGDGVALLLGLVGRCWKMLKSQKNMGGKRRLTDLQKDHMQPI
jgi:hypothetical protein